MTIRKQPFGTNPDGEKTTLWTIENSSGITLELIDWGATLVSLKQPDRNNHSENVALGFQDASRYKSSEGYLGATCGRYANRISRGGFTLEGRKYTLNCNDGVNHLHGGEKGFNSKLWGAEPYTEGDRSGVIFSLTSPDGDENYPGELKIKADYALDENNRLYMEFHAETDKTTIINITNHAYWNLAGASSGTILNHTCRFHASGYLPVDDNSIPTGEIAPVEGTPFDFREERKITGEYDHCMVIDGNTGNLRIAAEVQDPESGRKITLYTDRPGVQFYTGNFLKGNPFPRNGGFCLEPQDFPDAPNHPGFPPVVLRPGEIYHHRSFIEFSSQ